MTSSGTPGKWVDMLIGTTAGHTIDAEYPGAGSRAADRKTANIETLYAPTKDGKPVPRGRRVLLRQTVWLCKKQSTTTITTTRQPVSVLALRGGSWGYGARSGLFCLGVPYAPSHASGGIGFRGVLLIWKIWRSTWYNSTSV